MKKTTKENPTGQKPKPRGVMNPKPQKKVGRNAISKILKKRGGIAKNSN